MASNDTETPPHGGVSMEVPLKTSAPPPNYGSHARSFKKHAVIDMLLRVFLFALAVVSVVVMVTADETEQIPVTPRVAISRTAKFSYSPAYVFFVAALSVAALYGFITGLISILAVIKPGGNSAELKFYLVIFDSLLLGIVASATGASGGVGYIGLKGNSRSSWNKICNRFDTYCSHFKASILLSLIASITLLFLVWISVYVLSKKIARR